MLPRATMPRFPIAIASLVLTLGACDKDIDPLDGDGDSQALVDEESDAKAKDPDAKEPESEEPEAEEPEAEPEDFSQAGQDCANDGAKQACRIEGVDGFEFCQWDSGTWNSAWSQCLTETCETLHEEQECDEGKVQFCLHLGGERLWGECRAPGSCELGETKSCFGEDAEDEFDIKTQCIRDPQGHAHWDMDACNTPLVLNFGGSVEFQPAPVTAAAFSMHGRAGSCERADWPSATTPWLALDRDGDGAISGAQELFGSATPMASMRGPHHGFDALAELDSNGDGKLNAEDAQWGALVLWADHNGDRQSSMWEMLPLASFEIVEIDLGYTVRRECDGLGNCGIERANFVFNKGGRTSVGEVVDVHVACE